MTALIRQAAEAAERGFSRSILRAIVALRLLTLAWAAVGVVLGTEHLTRGWLAATGLAAMTVVTGATVWLVQTRPALLVHPAAVAVELIVAAGVLLIDRHAFTAERVQSLAWAWPSAGIITAAIFIAWWAGAASAIGLGFASWLGDARNSVSDWGVAASSKTALYVLAALVAAYVARRLRRAELEISTARAREEVARELHDGVLQTLAVVQRRSSDPELAALAEHQDRELRDYLFGVEAESRSLPVALREVAATVAARNGLRIEVICADDLPELTPEAVEAVAGAAGEAMTNADKHAGASRVVVYAEPEGDGVFCSIKDDGAGFDPDTTPRGQGLTGSIEARLHDLGGRSRIRSQPGRGTEVQLWTP